jgi:hypothetical protein
MPAIATVAVPTDIYTRELLALTSKNYRLLKACLVCFCSTINSRSKKIEKKPVLSCASSGHITKLEQSIFGLTISMAISQSFFFFG